MEFPYKIIEGTRCGYENIYYFSRAFRKAVGCSPSEFRERAR